jgi:hypothetical protein
VVGLLVWGDTGEPVEGGTVDAVDPSQTAATVLYADDDGVELDGTATGKRGLFLVVGGAAGESFTASVPGGTISDTELAGFRSGIGSGVLWIFSAVVTRS